VKGCDEMTKGPILYIVATETTPDKEEKFNKWYDEVHVPMLLGYRGIKNATRYKIINDMGENKGQATYLAFYEFENEEAFDGYIKSPALASALNDTDKTWKDGGFFKIWRAAYQPIQSWKR
jgi:antibiotic biosynthesis monooxygenase (ABM) superfamily enzyme